MSKKLPAIHPGEILLEEFMKPMALSYNALANALGVTPARINEIVRKKRGISADTALRLARFFIFPPCIMHIFIRMRTMINRACWNSPAWLLGLLLWE